MHLLVGLGNPGAKYARNRHNIGFMALDEIVRRHGFGPWRKRFEAQCAEGTLAGVKVLALKPETFMNHSGRSVGAAVRFYKLEPGDVTVIHDEIDLAPEKVRFKVGGGHAGHNGIRDVAAQIGADFARVRIGVGHPGLKDRVSGHVLDDFSKAEMAWVEPLIDAVAAAAPRLAAGDGPGFTNELGRILAPEKPAAKTEPAKAADGKAAPPERDGG
ncbi:MAG: aminoacyl-tRNA hydrolase [Alphaproteobacteria bacterium]|nr:aminoacyl-tRNA hydrolase [Alphaproteobacteria bacterium]